VYVLPHTPIKSEPLCN